jgi:hypothetical protein
MNVFNYIAQSNPEGVKEICRKYGYKLQRNARLGECVKFVVAKEGERALEDFMALHPDRQYFVEMGAQSVSMPSVKEKCTCRNCQDTDVVQKSYGADGSVDTASTQNALTMNFLVGAMVVLMAGTVMALVLKK